MGNDKIQFEKEAKPLNGKSANDNFDIVVLNFADSKIPEFKEVRNKDYILCGDKNDYPEYLVYQYNKCGKHRAIINGKTKYILGGGLEGEGGLAPVKGEDDKVTPAAYVNKDKETMYDVLKKSIKDIEIHGGFRWFITFDMMGRVAGISHDDFYKFRTGKEGGFYYKEKWFDTYGRPNHREEAKFYREFTGTAPGNDDENKVLVFAYNEYGPGCDYYPLPEYVGCSNYIDIDIEISKFHLSSLRNGMMPSKMIQFYTGEPTEDKKKEIERRFRAKFAGSENAGKFVLVFNTSKDKTVDIQDLSFNELDKQFDILNKTSEQQIFTGHQVTSPMLFGVKTEGQLGGSTELRTAYEIFINTYAKPKQADLEKIVNYFGGLLGKGSDYHFSQLDPVGLIFDVKDVLDKVPPEFILERLGVPKKYRNPAGTSALPAQQTAAATNDNIKNLTAKQYQQLVRIIREFNKGKIKKDAAALLLRNSLGLSDEDIEVLLAPDAPDDAEQMQKFAAEVSEGKDEDTVIQMFNVCGDLKSDFHIVKSKKVKFSSDKDAATDEISFYKQAFIAKVSISEANILDLISKDKRITPEVIAKTLGVSTEYVTAKIAKMVDKGILSTTEQVIGEDTQIERTLTKPLKEISKPPGDLDTTEILIKYSYEGPKDDRNRPFCAKLMALSRLYSRTEIENISQRLGYSVWDRRGGWWTKPDGTHSPTCRHRWVSHVVVRKNKGGAS